MRDAGTLLGDARDLLAGHFERCPAYRDARDLLTGRKDTLKCVPQGRVPQGSVPQASPGRPARPLRSDSTSAFSRRNANYFACFF